MFFKNQLEKFLVYLSVKDKVYYYETICSIMSFKEMNKRYIGKIVIYTDNVLFFEDFFRNENDFIFIEINNNKLLDLIGDSNYIYSLKIEILIEFSKKYKGKVIFVDCDTFFMKNINRLFSKINSKQFLLHCKEFKLSSGNNENYFKHLKDKPISISFFNKKILITTSIDMWNSGVIGFDTINISYLYFAKEILFEIKKNKIEEKTIEQLAISISFSQLKIQSCENYIFHYWFIKVFRIHLWKYYFRDEPEFLLNNNELNFKNDYFVKKILKSNLSSKNFKNLIFSIVNFCYSTKTKINIKKNFENKSYIFKNIK